MQHRTTSDAPSVDQTAGRRPVQDASRASQTMAGTLRRSRGPLDPRLVRRASATLPFMVAMVVAGAAWALLTVAQAWWLSRAISTVFATHVADAAIAAVWPLVGIFTGKAVIGWLNQWLAHRASASVKSQLRRDVMSAQLERPLDGDSSSLVTLVTQGLDALDGFYSKYLPQLVLAVVVPLIVGVSILTADWISTIIVAVTLPLIPIFMALVGWTTEARTKKRWELQLRLARHFSDLVEGLPTLQVFGRARAQLEGLRRTEAAARTETMATLRVSFLSALVLELVSTLSVAIVAVSTGFRVLYGQFDLTNALFVLILAPEVYLPLRQVGAHYHDSADGMAAAASAFEMIDGQGGTAPAAETASPTDAASAPDTSTPRATASDRPDDSLIAVRDLGHTYPGSDAPALDGLSFDVPRGRLVVLVGPSGGGKTTALNALMGFIAPSRGEILVDGMPLVPSTMDAWRRRTAYVGQNPGMLSGDIAHNVRLGFPGASDADVRAALDDAGGADLALDHGVGDDGEGLSAGERRRVAVARALLRIRLGSADVLLLDEPTAGLDADAEAHLLAGVRELGVAAVIVSHRPAVIAAADSVVEIGGVR